MSAGGGLSIHGRLTLTLEGHRIHIHAQGGEITVDLPDRKALWTAMKYLPRLPGGHGEDQTDDALAARLRDSGVVVHIRLAGSELATLGGDAHPGWLSRLLHTGPIRVKPSGLWGLLKGTSHEKDEQA